MFSMLQAYPEAAKTRRITVLHLKNPDSIPLDYPGKSADRHMAVLRRPGGEKRGSVIVG